MFIAIYKATFRNLFRSATFWLCLTVFFIVAFQNATSIHYGTYKEEFQEVIVDTDSRFILSYSNTCKEFSNSARHLLQYILPLFATITTVIILHRDYGDCFYEVEKANGIKHWHYLLAKLSALITLNYFVSVVAHFFAFHTYVFTRGGVAGMGLCDYFLNTTYRLMINNFFRFLPCIIFFVCFTYAIGTVSKSRIIAALGGMIYTIASFVIYRYTLMKSSIFLNYFTPNPLNLERYLYGYFDDNLKYSEISSGEAGVCLVIFFGFSLLFSLIAYLRIRKRTV